MKTVTDIGTYIAGFPQEVQEKLKELRKVITEELPKAEETISYRIPTFKMNGTYVVYFAAFKHHISLYPISTSIEKGIKDIAAYKTSGKGTIQFPLDKPLPFPLIRKIVKALLQESIKRRQK